MAVRRLRNWHRAGPAIATAAILSGLSAQGCGGSDTGSSNGGSTTTTTTSSTATGGTGGTGGATGGTGGSTGGGAPSVQEAAKAKAFDSTPDSAGEVIYFTASGDEGPAVYSVPADGGTVTKVFAGDPLAAPLGISISNDDKTLFVADPGAEANVDDPKTALGAIFSIPAGGGTPTVLNGSSGTMPRGVDIGDDGGEETLFFTGVDGTGKAGVFKMPVGGGTPSAVAVGAPFVDPSGIAVGKTQTFVTDTVSSATKMGAVIVIANGEASVFLPEIGVGYPTGVALSADEKTLYLSGIDPDTGTDVVLVVDVATKNVTPFNGGDVGKNRDAAGLHRARKTDVFSWADLSAGNGAGGVYRVTFK
ncbi:MAG: hypothetical protein U0441_36560 [Polyangiaceae bacterium]